MEVSLMKNIVFQFENAGGWRPIEKLFNLQIELIILNDKYISYLYMTVYIYLVTMSKSFSSDTLHAWKDSFMSKSVDTISKRLFWIGCD